jgi:hypothetical protein
MQCVTDGFDQYREIDRGMDELANSFGICLIVSRSDAHHFGIRYLLRNARLATGMPSRRADTIYDEAVVRLQATPPKTLPVVTGW